ncbi:hypothetical protein Cgig2_009487 [Carnegiea gigantea]|uniref:Uncharacterized protein n=1 Tax=Carnegiea gigantea TaxID=171969 RepID=A0A9Q1GST2_9CARY|nr:hypothetical protein Cgig2_009487 [Carnegiea gigantea]
MSASRRLSTLLTLSLPPTSSSSRSRTFFFNPHPPFLSPPCLHHHHHHHHHRALSLSSASASVAGSTMPCGRGRGVTNKEGRWQVKSTPAVSSSVAEGAKVDGVEGVTDGLRGLSVAEQSGQGHATGSPMQFEGALLQNQTVVPGQKAVWKPKSYGTLGGATAAPVEQVAAEQKASQVDACERSGAGASLDGLFRRKLLENFTVDNNTYSHAQIRATFYPKFENEKSDQEIRTRMIDMVSKGLATVEVTLKHSGSLFMYAGHQGGAYAKNSFGNIRVPHHPDPLPRFRHPDPSPTSTQTRRPPPPRPLGRHSSLSAEHLQTSTPAGPPGRSP